MLIIVNTNSNTTPQSPPLPALTSATTVIPPPYFNNKDGDHREAHLARNCPSCISVPSPSSTRFLSSATYLSISKSFSRLISSSMVRSTLWRVPTMSQTEQPCSQMSCILRRASWTRLPSARRRMALTSSMEGASQMWRTRSSVMTCPWLAKWQAWMLLTAWRMSPSAMKSSVLKACSVMRTPSPSTTRLRLSSTSPSRSRPKRRMMQRLWMGSMILEEVLQLSTKRVLSLKLLMIMRSACCAPSVRLSASSSTMIFVFPGGSATFFCANDFICSRTTSIPRSSEAFSYSVASLNCPSSNSRTMHSTLDVFPTPGGPARIRLGIVPWETQARSVLICSTLPQTSARVLGRYFSNQIYFIGGIILIKGGVCQTQLWILRFLFLILIMNEGKPKRMGERVQLSPLLVDTEFVPSQLRYFALFNRALSPAPTVLPYRHDSDSLIDLELKVTHPTPNNNSPPPLHKKDSIKKLKYRSCKKRIDGEEVETGQEGSVNFESISSSSESESCERIDLCLIIMEREEVIHLSFRWRSEDQAREEILGEVNRACNAALTVNDLRMSSLLFECQLDERGVTTLKMRPSPLGSLRDHIFETDALTYIGIHLPSKLSKAKSPPKVVSAINAASDNYIEFSIPRGSKFKMSFERVKQFQVREILGILGVERPQSRGLVVMNQVYEPTALLYTLGAFFKERAMVNYLSASVAEEGEVLFEEIMKSPPLTPGELKRIAEEDCRFRDRKGRSLQKELSALSLFNSECHIHNSKETTFNLLYHVIHRSIRNFFTHYNNFFDSSISNRFIQSLLEQVEDLPPFQGETYRRLGYELDCQKGDILEFNNFILASKDSDILHIQLPKISQSRVTHIKILSETGRVVGTHTGFEGLSEVIFVPFTLFEVAKREENSEVISLTLRETKRAMSRTESSVILWLDNKESEGRAIYSHLRSLQTSIFLYQFNSNSELQDWINNHKRCKDAFNIRVVLITNMRRIEDGISNNNAGVETINLARILLKKATIIVYVGSIEFTIKNLMSSSIDPKTLKITNNANQLLQIIKEECLQVKANIQLMANIFEKIGKQDSQDYMSFIKENESENPFELVKQPEMQAISYKSPQKLLYKPIGQVIKEKTMMQPYYKEEKAAKKVEVAKSKIHEPAKPAEQLASKYKSAILTEEFETDLPTINNPVQSKLKWKSPSKEDYPMNKKK